MKPELAQLIPGKQMAVYLFVFLINCVFKNLLTVYNKVGFYKQISILLTDGKLVHKTSTRFFQGAIYCGFT